MIAQTSADTADALTVLGRRFVVFSARPVGGDFAPNSCSALGLRSSGLVKPAIVNGGINLPLPWIGVYQPNPAFDLESGHHGK